MSFGIRSQSININRKILIKELEKGRDTHRVEFEEAEAEYKVAVLKFLGEALARASKGDFTNLVLTFSKPVNHAADYDNVIELLSFSEDETINLDSDAFRSYVKGEWSWKSQFESASMMIKTYLGN